MKNLDAKNHELHLIILKILRNFTNNKICKQINVRQINHLKATEKVYGMNTECIVKTEKLHLFFFFIKSRNIYLNF